MSMFELNLFESKEVNILDEVITESDGKSEFAPKSPASPTEHIDPAASGEKDVAPKPAETPAAKPADGEMGPVNANTQPEAPTAKPYDTTPIKNAGKVVLTSDQYNQALKQLQQSFKEAAEITEALQQVTIVDDDLDALQEAFTEAAIITSLEDGPYFERVEKEDKEEVKKITRDIRDDLNMFFTKEAKAQSGKFYKPNVIRVFLSTIFNHRMWQVAGVALIEEDVTKQNSFNGEKAAEKLCAAATKKFADKLNGYKLIPYLVGKTYLDLFRTNLGIKDDRLPFFIIVDKEYDPEIKKEITSAEEKAEK